MLAHNLAQKFERRQLFDSFRDYDPWGRAGGGAPAGDVRRRDLLSRNIFPQQPGYREIKERVRPPLRLKHRPHLSFHHEQIKQNELPKEPPDIGNYGEHRAARHQECEHMCRLPKMIQPQKVWSSNPWEGRGPWGGRGPGGLPWRAAGDVGRNFHYSMGWTTDNTFHFPSISCGASAANKENVMHHILNTDHHKRSKANKIPPIKITAVGESPNPHDHHHPMGEAMANAHSARTGTPNERLLAMTGGVELVPLMRARAWTHKRYGIDED